MCGIAGCYQQPDGHKLADVMTERIAHRGPDAGGVWTHEDDRVSVHLGHRRLSIIDLSAAADQPMIKDNLVMVYNGELYNYRELRRSWPAAASASPRTPTPRSWSRPGVTGGPGPCRSSAACSRSRWPTTKTGELFLARDPLGIKPLFYLQRGHGALFASELKALTAAVGPELRIEPGALVASMLYYWVPEQFCAIEGVRKLPAGSWARLRPDGDLQVEQYWNVADVARDARHSPAPDLRRVIEESVTAHLVADVPVSSFLSGGLDSSIITVLAHRAAQEIDAYTITFRPEDQRLEAMPDDAIYARKVAAQYGVKLHEIEISPDIVDLLPRMVDALDEPIGDPAAINTLLMCQAARDRGVKVILSGMGADELFGGYRKQMACLMASRYGRLPGPARAAARFAVDRAPVSVGEPGPALRPLGQALPHLRRAARGTPVPAQLHAVRPGRPGRPAQPGPARPGGPGDRRPPRDLHRQRPGRRGQPDVPGRLAAVPARPEPVLLRPVQHGRLGGGPGAVRGPGGGPGRVLRSRAGTRSAAGRASWRSSGPPRPGCPRRSSTGPRPRSAHRCGPGSATTCRTSSTTCSSTAS